MIECFQTLNSLKAFICALSFLFIVKISHPNCFNAQVHSCEFLLLFRQHNIIYEGKQVEKN